MAKHKIFLVGVPEIAHAFIRYVKNLPDVLIENNFEQVYGMVRSKLVSKICILCDVWNFSGDSYNAARGQTAAEKIHIVDPSIPILIWDGRKYGSLEEKHPMFQVKGEAHPIRFKNELYLYFKDYEGELQNTLTGKFFGGTLKEEDVPVRDCLSFSF